MEQWILSNSQKELMFNRAGQMKVKLQKQQQCIKCMSIQIKMLSDELHERQERVRQARELLISIKPWLIGGVSRELEDVIDRFIKEETE